MRTCSVEGCNNKHYCKGYCCRHYNQIRRCGHILERSQRDANEIIEHEDYAEIVVYNKQNEETAKVLIDLEYVDLVKKYKWSLANGGYVHNPKVSYLHRFIMNPPENMVVDHINHNKLDNRKCNLRICTQHQNNMNSGKRKNLSGVTGVHWCRTNNKWVAQIRINGKGHTLGYFNTIEEAIEARRQAEIEYFGEFAPDRE